MVFAKICLKTILLLTIVYLANGMLEFNSINIINLPFNAVGFIALLLFVFGQIGMLMYS